MKKPNIIYILADDMGYGDVSRFNENAAFQTPCFDQLCDEGMHFTDAHATSAVCTPSRYSILTGCYNWRSWLKQGVLYGYDKPLINDELPTVASFLQTKGYHTSCVGKWHLGLEWALTDPDNKESIDYTSPLLNTPIHHGFDYFYGISASLDMPPYVYIENDQVTAPPNRTVKCDTNTSTKLTKHWFREGEIGADFVIEDVLPTLTKKVLAQIEEKKEQPFFIYFPITGPHTPILPSKEFQGKSGTNTYGDFVLMCDDVVGQVNHKLKELGLDENTIIIYTSDNGCSPMANFPELAQYGHNPSYIFRGNKADIFEGGHRVPLIVKWPDQIPKNTQSSEPVCLVDLFATVTDIFDELPAENSAIDSVSNLAIWKNEPYTSPLHDTMVHHSINGSFSIRKGPWKYEACGDSGGWSEPMPGTLPDNAPTAQLYNLKTDVREVHNLINQHSDIADELKSLLEEAIK